MTEAPTEKLTLLQALALLEESGCGITSDGKGGISLEVPSGQVFPRELAPALSQNAELLKKWAKFTPWNGQNLGESFSLDTETQPIPKAKGAAHPRMVLGVAWNGSEGVYLMPAQVEAFLQAHAGSKVIFHNASFDLGVLSRECQDFDVYRLVDQDQICDSLLMEALLGLAFQGKSMPDQRGTLALDAVARKRLGLDLGKDEGIRLTYGDHATKPLEQVPLAHRVYAALDAVATFEVWEAQLEELPKVRKAASKAYGFSSQGELSEAWAKFGILSHNVQLRGSIALDAMSRLGVGSDAERRKPAEEAAFKAMAEAQVVLEEAGLFQEDKVKAKAVAAYLEAAEERLLSEGKLGRALSRTSVKGEVSANSTNIQAILDAESDPILEALARYKKHEKWVSTYLQKFTGQVLHPRWNLLLESGRVSCSGDLAAQTLPKDDAGPENLGFSVRQLLRPLAGMVFIGADFGTLEVRSFAFFLEQQMRFGSGLANVIREGHDVHSTVASIFTGKPVSEIERKSRERNVAKIVVFALPGAMTNFGLERTMRAQGFDLTPEELEGLVEGYFKMAPEAKLHLQDKTNLGDKIATAFDLESREHGWAMFKIFHPKQQSRLTQEQKEPYWKRFEEVIPQTLGLGAKQTQKLLEKTASRKASQDLWQKLSLASDQTSCLSSSGRLRAKASFRASRNHGFQAPAADGAILGLYRLWREGHNPCLFIHDEVVCLKPEGCDYAQELKSISQVMEESMAVVLGGLPIETEGFVRTSLSPKDSIALPEPAPTPQEEPELVLVAGEEPEEEEEEELPPENFFWVDTLSNPQPEPQPELPASDHGMETEGDDVICLTVATPKPRKKRNPSGYSRKVRPKALPEPVDSDDDGCPF